MIESDAIEQARLKYLPAESIKVLFIAEAPPADSTRFFYFEHVRTHDWLYLAMMRALYPETCELAVSTLRCRKSQYLQRFQLDGLFLIDACNNPMPHDASASAKRCLIEASLPKLIGRACGLVSADTLVVLISSTVHAVCYEPLTRKGINVVNTSMIPFPASGRQRDFQKKLIRTLRSVNVESKATSWSKTADGSFVDEKGGFVYFSRP